MDSHFLVRSKAALINGFDSTVVQQQLVAKGLSPQQAAMVLAKPVVLKKGLHHSQAIAYVEQMEKLGVAVKLERTAVEKKVAKDIFPELLAQFSEPIAKPSMSKAFRNSAIIAMLSATIAPLIYALVVASIVFAIWHYYGFILGVDVGNIYLNILLYALPAFVGLFILAFLLSPLTALGYRDTRITLDCKRYAKLYQLCETIANAMGVPAPNRICVDDRVNASASGGLIDLMQGKLTLTLGLPLVACASVEQLVGIIAHEYGHFAQRKSMLAYSWINRVSFWLARSGYGDGIWLARLKKWRQSTDSELIIATLAVCKWLLIVVRSFFRELYIINLRLTRDMSRQMEYDADQYEVCVVGSKQFVESSKQLHYAGTAWSIANDLNSEAYFERDQLISNFSLATKTVLAAMPKEVIERINQQMKETQTQFYDTHPADYDRIKRAIKANQDGMFRSSKPASLLFHDFERLCKSVTHMQYRDTDLLDINECLTDRPSWLDTPFGKPTTLQKAG